jgi:TPR repeat protein
MLMYGFGLARGYLWETDILGSMSWFKKAADLGEARGMIFFADGLKKGDLGEKDLKGSLEWYKKAADACVMRPFFHSYFPNDNKSFQEKSVLNLIIEMNIKDLEQDFADAMFEYGCGLEDSFLGFEDLDGAILFYKISAENGNTDAENYFSLLTDE